MTAETAAATLLAYVRATGAERASAIVEAGIVDVAAPDVAFLQRTEEHEPEALDPGEALELGVETEPLPPFRVDVERGEVDAPLGALERFADGVRALARALGPGTVALVAAPTSDGTPFALSAREGEGLVVVIGDDQYPWTST
jgi:hypothetical protein